MVFCIFFFHFLKINKKINCIIFYIILKKEIIILMCPCVCPSLCVSMSLALMERVKTKEPVQPIFYSWAIFAPIFD